MHSNQQSTALWFFTPLPRHERAGDTQGTRRRGGEGLEKPLFKFPHSKPPCPKNNTGAAFSKCEAEEVNAERQLPARPLQDYLGAPFSKDEAGPPSSTSRQGCTASQPRKLPHI